MPKIVFVHSGDAPGSSGSTTRVAHLTVDAPPGRLIDVCDEARAPVPFSCRSASCGTCRIEVLRGAELLSEPGPDELDVLEIFASPPNHRLACRAAVVAGEGELHLRVVDDDGR